jgi:hypothetical protein
VGSAGGGFQAVDAGGAAAGGGGAAAGGGAAGGGADVDPLEKFGIAGFSTWYSCHEPHSMIAAPATKRANERIAVMLSPPM